MGCTAHRANDPDVAPLCLGTRGLAGLEQRLACGYDRAAASGGLRSLPTVMGKRAAAKKSCGARSAGRHW